VNRVIVLSDGDANIGPSSHSEILDRIAKYKEQGITLSTVGFGKGNYKDTMMEQLADKGDGNYSTSTARPRREEGLLDQVDGCSRSSRRT
jgi:Ca-activated chloride channel family protein